MPDLLPRRALAAYVAVAAADTWLAGRTPTTPVRTARWVTKPALMPLLALARPPRSTGAAVALAGSWAGDVALLAHDARPMPSLYRAGVGSFAVAHAGYLAAMSPQVSRERLGSRLVRGLALAGVVGGPAMGLSAARVDRGLGVAVAAYSLCVSGTAALGAATAGPGARWLAVGGATFLASDATLGTRDLLLAGRPAAGTRWMERIVMATYTAAQAMLAQGLRR
ncbi:lysoplasmalogenase [Nocardioides acrostichi]|uniref:Lysoplasmalogenase n=1 Tax=Nocardioides acrostichi TaxID=2784339 RepID=A0A930UXA7_9ACTN|nr:lysoplasmalogenase [Nocardioides acrostichi]MBF4161397.1 lysoplasmalogenase [Nocardioides acrostichi]